MGLVVKEGAGVEMIETPSQEIVAAGNKSVNVLDSRSRVLTVKKLGTLDRMRLFAAAGPELAMNDRWMGLAAIACSVVAIDGQPEPKPATVREIESLVDRLEDDGLEAVGQAYKDHFGVGADVDLKAKVKN